MGTLKALQEAHREWSKKNFPDNQPWQPLLGIGEEVGELMHHYLKKSQGIRGKEDHEIGMADSAADIIIYLLDFCNQVGIDLEYVLLKTIEGVWKMGWQKNPDTAHEGHALIDEIRTKQVLAGESAVIQNLKKMGL